MREIIIQRGNPYGGRLTITDDSVTPAVALNLTGRIVFISVKSLEDDADDDSGAVISSEITSHVAPDEGITDWLLTPAQTLIPKGKYKADVRVYTSDLVFINSEKFYVYVIDTVTKRIT